MQDLPLQPHSQMLQSNGVTQLPDRQDWPDAQTPTPGAAHLPQLPGSDDKSLHVPMQLLPEHVPHQVVEGPLRLAPNALASFSK